MPAPLCTADNCRAAYQLNWSVSIFWRTSPPRDFEWLAPLKTSTERVGVRILERHWPVIAKLTDDDNDANICV